MARLRQILVIGNNTNGCTPRHEEIAYQTGSAIAGSGSVLITGGLGGVMAAASHGASDAGGISIGIVPQDDNSMANEHCSIVIPTGMGLARDFLNALSADGIIIIGGGSGTLSEVCAAYMYKKPMVAIRGLGGSVEQYIGGYLDHRGKRHDTWSRHAKGGSAEDFGDDLMNPIFELSTRKYTEEIGLIKKAMSDLESRCDIKNGYTIGEPFEKFGWTFFNVRITAAMSDKIERSGMMEGALGYKIGEQLTNFIGHYLESKGSNVRIKQIDYG